MLQSTVTFIYLQNVDYLVTPQFEKKESEFNSSLDVLTRINLLFHQANINDYDGNYKGWAKMLAVIYRELKFFIPQEKRKEIADLVKECFEGTLRVNGKEISAALYWKLNKLDGELKFIFHDCGLGIKQKPENDDWDL